MQRRTIASIGAAALLIVGFGIGSAAHGSPSAAPATPAPTQTVTVTKEVPPAVVTPECAAAFAAAEKVMADDNQGWTVVSDSFKAETAGDYATVSADAQKLNDIATTKAKDLAAYKAAEGSCR